MNRILPFLCVLALLGGCSKPEVMTDAVMATDPTGTWIAAEGSPEVMLESGGRLSWKQNGQTAEGKWSSPAANQLVLELPSGSQKYRFQRDMFGLKLTSEDGKTLSFTTM